MKTIKKIICMVLIFTLFIVTGCSKNWSEEKSIYDKVTDYGFKWSNTDYILFAAGSPFEFEFHAYHGAAEEILQCYVDKNGETTLILYYNNKDYGNYYSHYAPYDPNNEYGDVKAKMVKAKQDYKKFLKIAKIKESEFHKFMDYVWYLHDEKGKFPSKTRE
ncbi:MAG: hypothetical protein PHH04_03705 [Thomasclavelia sp.]|nr:hypothetical protein [Tissierellia bacterium]MDD8048691.1 hypothetical protein [Thomasclavelia sp.]